MQNIMQFYLIQWKDTLIQKIIKVLHLSLDESYSSSKLQSLSPFDLL